MCQSFDKLTELTVHTVALPVQSAQLPIYTIITMRDTRLAMIRILRIPQHAD